MKSTFRFPIGGSACFLALCLTPAASALNNDGQTDILWRQPASSANDAWAMNGGVNTGTISLPAASGPDASN